MNASSLDTQIPLRKQRTKYISLTIVFSMLNIKVQKLFNKKQPCCTFLPMQLKQAIEIEYEICNKNKTLVKFENLNFIYNKL